MTIGAPSAAKVRPNSSLELTRSGRARLAAPGQPVLLSLRGQSHPASAGSSAKR